MDGLVHVDDDQKNLNQILEVDSADASRSRSVTNNKRNEQERWADEKLLRKLKKFANFRIDEEGKDILVLRIEGKKLLNDSQIILNETLRRYTKIRSFAIVNCFIDDDYFRILLDYLSEHESLQNLVLEANMLSKCQLGELSSFFLIHQRV